MIELSASQPLSIFCNCDKDPKKFKRYTATYGQDWNDALYAMAKIESRFRDDSKIEYGNTLNDDKFYIEEFDVATANPPYGVDWKGYRKTIEDDKTGRFKYLPSISDGQLLFMQHLISKLNDKGLAVVVHNGSTLFSGDAGSSESNIRKWMFDNDLVEAIIQNPTSEFFNTGIYTYLWVINKNKAPERKDQVLLIDASKKFTPLKKNKGDKRNEIDKDNRLEIVEALTRFEDCEFARKFSKYHFYYNKQAILLTNIDENGNTFADHLPMVTKRDGSVVPAKSVKLDPVSLSDGKRTVTEFIISDYDRETYGPLSDLLTDYWKPWIAGLDYREQLLEVATADASYRFDNDRETLVMTTPSGEEVLGCGKIVVRASLKKKTKKLPERIVITIELMPDTQKDYEIIPFDPDPEANQANIEEFMAKYIFKPFEYIENVVGVEINFNKIFYKPEELRSLTAILSEISDTGRELAQMEGTLEL